MLQPIVSGPTNTSDMARKVVNAMQVPFDLSGAARTIYTSIGISLLPNDGAEIKTRIRNAE